MRVIAPHTCTKLGFNLLSIGSLTCNISITAHEAPNLFPGADNTCEVKPSLKRSVKISDRVFNYEGRRNLGLLLNDLAFALMVDSNRKINGIVKHQNR